MTFVSKATIFIKHSTELFSEMLVLCLFFIGYYVYLTLEKMDVISAEVAKLELSKFLYRKNPDIHPI